MKKTLTLLVALVLAGTAQPAQAATPSTVDPAALRDQLSRIAPPGSATRVDPVTGKVHMRVPTGAASRAMDGLARRHAHQVIVERTPATIGTLAAIVGGNGVDGPLGSCTAGFMADQQGRRVALIAGHCTEVAGGWYRRGKYVGPTLGSVFGPEGDFGMIGISYNYSAEPKVASYYTGSYGTQPVMGIQGLPIPSHKLLCKTGRMTGWTCGNALAYDVTLTLASGVTVGGLIETDICAAAGDSGSPLFTSAFVSNPPGAMAAGILSAGPLNLPCSDPRYRTYYQPIQEVLDYYGVTLLTAINA